MIKAYDRNMRALGILENAYQIGYETPLNQVWSASFRLPLDDPKNELCHHFNFVEVFDNGERVDLFRIMPTQTTKSESDRSITYQCEHVLATLHDDSIGDYAQWTNVPTETVLEDMLSFQEIQRWTLGNVEIERFFHYGVDKEDLLPAIFSVPKPFDEPFQWTWDTSVYPWILNLEQASTEIVGEARWGRNIKGITKDSDPVPMATRIYPYGYGEGVNQLNIERVNPTGRRYIQDDDAVEQYGIIKYHWVDRRFEDAESLYASARALLKEMSRPKVSYSVDLVELKSLGDLNRYDVGKLVRIVDDDMGTVLQRVYDYRKPDTSRTFEVNLEIGDKLEDLGTTQADLDRRQKINETYSQGATNMNTESFYDNADEDYPAVMRVYIPEETVRINKMELNFFLEAFRGYSRATEGGGATTTTTESGGGTTATSSSGGGTTATSSSGGGTTATSSSGGGESTTSGTSTRLISKWEDEKQTIPPTGQQAHTYYDEHIDLDDLELHTHSISISNHTHDVEIPDHTHDVDIPDHTHNVEIPDHTHEIELPDHAHEIEHGIYEGPTASEVSLEIDGNEISVGTSENNFDLIPYLQKDANERIERGTWHEIRIKPNGLTRVVANIFTQFFIQSRGGGDY